MPNKSSFPKFMIVLLVIGLVIGIGGGHFLTTRSFQSKIIRLEYRFTNISSDLENLNKSVLNLEQENSNLIAKVSGLEKKILNYNSQIYTLQADLKKAEGKIPKDEDKTSDLRTSDVIFRGVNIPHLESRWKGFDIKSELSRIRSLSFNGVRLHLYWEDITPDSFDVIDTDAFTDLNGRAGSIDDFVNWCEDVNLYIMLTLRIDGYHPPPAWAFSNINRIKIPVPDFDRAAYWDMMMSGEARDELESIKNIWKFIADRYKDRDHVLFDIFNEPRAGELPQQTIAKNYKTFAEDVIQTIRIQENYYHTIIVEEYEFLTIPDNIEGDAKVLRDIHFYTPWQSPYSHDKLPEIERDFRNRVSRLRTNGLKVQCGEFGRRVYPITDPGSEEWFNDIFTIFEDNNIEDWWVYNWAPHVDEPYSIVKPDASPIEPYFSLIMSKNA